MSTQRAENTSPTARKFKKETDTKQRASTPTSDSDNDSTRAQLGSKRRDKQFESQRSDPLPYGVSNSTRLTKGRTSYPASTEPNPNDSATHNENPFAASNSSTYPYSNVQSNSSSGPNPFSIWNSGPPSWGHTPTGQPLGQSLPYAPGYSSTPNYASTTWNNSFAPGTPGHTPGHYMQYQYPPSGYSAPSNPAFPQYNTPNSYAPYQPTTSQILQSGYNPPPSYFNVSHNHSEAFTSSQSAKPGRYSPPGLPPTAGRLSEQQKAAGSTGPNPTLAPADRFANSHSIKPVAVSLPNDILKSSLSDNTSASSPSAAGVPSSPNRVSTPAFIGSHYASSLPDDSFSSSHGLSVANLLADLSLIENEVLPKGDFIMQWQNATRTGQDTTEDVTIQTIYHACMECYHFMLPTWYKALGGKDALKHTLYRNHILLRDWGASYAVLDGQLDQLPKEAEDVTETISSFLIEISTILIHSKNLQSIVQPMTNAIRNSKVNRSGVER
jgi:hypothetical protein